MCFLFSCVHQASTLHSVLAGPVPVLVFGCCRWHGVVACHASYPVLWMDGTDAVYSVP